jgi:ParB/RepB/Spo0J family partition protein
VTTATHAKDDKAVIDGLFPEERGEGVARRVPLECLPEDSDLLCPPPDKGLVESVRRLGVLQNIILRARFYEDSSVLGGLRIDLPYEVVAGRRRIMAARAAGLPDVPALVYPSDYGTLEVLAVAENAQRGANRPQELTHLQALLRRGLSESQIARATGMGLSSVRKRLRLQHLSHVLSARWEAGAIADSVAEQAALLTPEQQTWLERQTEVTGATVRQARHAEVKEASHDLDDLFLGLPEGSAPTGRAHRVGQLLMQVRCLVTDTDDPGLREHIDAALGLVATLQDAPAEEEEIPIESVGWGKEEAS